MPGNPAKLLVFRLYLSAKDFVRSALSFSMYSTMVTRLASAVLVHLTAIFCEERIDFVGICELAPICFSNTLLDVLDLPSLDIDVLTERSHRDCDFISVSDLSKFFKSAGRRTVCSGRQLQLFLAQNRFKCKSLHLVFRTVQ